MRLRFRRNHRLMMSRGGYGALRARGTRASAVVAFERTEPQCHLVVVIPRLVERSASRCGWPIGSAFWAVTEVRIPARVSTLTNILSSKTVGGGRSWAPLSELAQRWPWVALCGRE